MSGHIQDARLYSAVRAAAADLLHNIGAPSLIIPTSQVLQRVVDRKYVFDPSGKFDPSLLRENLVPRDAGWDTNRFTGVDASGQPQKVGGLYAAVNSGGLAAEAGHYATKAAVAQGATVPHVGFVHALTEKAIIEFSATRTLLLLDLEDTAHVRRFFEQIVTRPAVRDAWAAAKSRKPWTSAYDAMFDSGSDFTVSRAIGHAAADQQFLGVRAPSARQSDRAGELGMNIILFGPCSQPISFVRPKRVFIFLHRRGASEPEWVQHAL